ncbi:MAG TPA: hypothetical protein VEC36_08420 [Patescibacteria group bacterium]|nr:hypothetical protein [Patescibacteria group bacterium]
MNLVGKLEAQGIAVIPVMTFSCAEEFKNQMASIHKQYKRGVYPNY